ncbi:hypothetical protein M9H77_07590 [Catharanthus roseus]|uniref:Uncharacterized protein n=1 Tax=Catharanthus roseus TaxID=4058 RepID=A0ACC0BVC4_CATRO|nr:hypothetical protein M9H77_07590 [Catharanthus roseus]
MQISKATRVSCSGTTTRGIDFLRQLMVVIFFISIPNQTGEQPFSSYDFVCSPIDFVNKYSIWVCDYDFTRCNVFRYYNAFHIKAGKSSILEKFVKLCAMTISWEPPRTPINTRFLTNLPHGQSRIQHLKIHTYGTRFFMGTTRIALGTTCTIMGATRVIMRTTHSVTRTTHIITLRGSCPYHHLCLITCEFFITLKFNIMTLNYGLMCHSSWKRLAAFDITITRQYSPEACNADQVGECFHIWMKHLKVLGEQIYLNTHSGISSSGNTHGSAVNFHSLTNGLSHSHEGFFLKELYQNLWKANPGKRKSRSITIQDNKKAKKG